jgi:hypothetical protein
MNRWGRERGKVLARRLVIERCSVRGLRVYHWSCELPKFHNWHVLGVQSNVTVSQSFYGDHSLLREEVRDGRGGVEGH